MTKSEVHLVVIGSGPAGLMAAEFATNYGLQVDLYDSMPSVGRKFLLAGKGGMNITHAEDFSQFVSRYGIRQQEVQSWLTDFDPTALRTWISALGVDTFVGSSGRVFPSDMKAAPLLRLWLHRLRTAGVRFHMRHRWTGWDDDGALRFSTPEGNRQIAASATILALGGGSWKRLGSDGTWVELLSARGIEIAPLQPSNCGFDTHWSEYFRHKFAGQPLKSIAASLVGHTDLAHQTYRGECMITEYGIEGSLVYALSSHLRNAIHADGSATLYLDLLPDWSLERVYRELMHPRGARSMSSHLQSRLHLKGVKVGLLRECLSATDFHDMQRLAHAIKSLPLPLLATRPLDEAISSAGGVRLESMTPNLMLRHLPGVFCAGEMLDWEAPTGGYLLTACFASGRVAAQGAINWLKQEKTT